MPEFRLRGALHRHRVRIGVYAAAVLGLWPLPLVGLLHVEAAAVVAAVAYGVAGWGAVGAFRRGEAVGRVVRDELLLLLVPLAGLTATLLWRPNCGYLAGLGFFVLFPAVTVVFSVAVAYALTGTRLRRPRAALLLLGAALALLGPAYDLGLHPQFYTYNHVFGGVLGPIYDEELAVRPGLFAFRGLTLAWAALLSVAGRRLRGARGAGTGAATFGLVLLIGGAYAFAGPLGINTPAAYLQRALGGTFRSAHFDLYFDPAAVTPDEAARLALDHEYHYARLAAALGVVPDGRVASYLYPDAAAKAWLVGARRTNVAPVWLARPQAHVLLGDYGAVFPHELVHVFSRAFGLPVVNASVAVGLVEGVAVALEPPDGRPTPDEQVAAAALARAGPAGEVDLAERVAATLSPFGFWTGRGAVSYTTMGSFVRYLLDAYGPAPFRAAYPWGGFEAAYGKPVAVLAAEWERHVLGAPVVARAAGPLATRRFAVPSLFEVRCPHHVPAFVRLTRAGGAALEAGDPAEAAALLADALRAAPTYVPALGAWSAARLALGDADAVAARLDTLAPALRAPGLTVLLGDARALRGETEAARSAYADALAALPPYAHETRALLVARRAVAGRADVVAALVAARPPAETAAALGALAERTEAVEVLRAVRYAEGGAPADALALLASTALDSLAAGLPRGTAGTLRAQRLAWLAAFAERAGRLEAAARYAADAEDAFRALGDGGAAARLAALRARLLWSARPRAAALLLASSPPP